MQQTTIGTREIQLYWFTGTVLSASKSRETKVHGGGGGGYGGSTAPVTISSTTTVHDQLFLLDKTGTERAFQLTGFDVACRDGNEVSVVWAMRAGKDRGPYVYVENHTVNSSRFDTNGIRRLVSPSFLKTLGIMLAAFIALASLNFGFGGFFLVLIGGLGWQLWAVKQRTAEFKAKLAELPLRRASCPGGRFGCLRTGRGSAATSDRTSPSWTRVTCRFAGCPGGRPKADGIGGQSQPARQETSPARRIGHR